MALTVETFDSEGSFTWTCPYNIIGTVKVECYGGGAPGSGVPDLLDYVYAGGSGGQYAVAELTLSAGGSYSVIVGATKNGIQGNGGHGNDSTFNADFVVAKGGRRAIGNIPGLGETTDGIGDTVYAGGDGAAGVVNTGGGGGGAGSTGDGGDASGSTGGSAGGGSAGAGGNGVSGGVTTDGLQGNQAGGGGSGGVRVDSGGAYGGDGARGLVIISYTLNTSNHFFILTQQ